MEVAPENLPSSSVRAPEGLFLPFSLVVGEQTVSCWQHWAFVSNRSRQLRSYRENEDLDSFLMKV